MKKNAFVKPLVIAGGFLFLCAAPKLTFGQSGPPDAAPHPPMKSALRPPPPDLLEGLTLTDDQKAKIDQIREDTKSRLADVGLEGRGGTAQVSVEATPSTREHSAAEPIRTNPPSKPKVNRRRPSLQYTDIMIKGSETH